MANDIKKNIQKTTVMTGCAAGGTATGGGVGACLGFLVGGPIGAAVGFKIGMFLGGAAGTGVGMTINNNKKD